MLWITSLLASGCGRCVPAETRADSTQSIPPEQPVEAVVSMLEPADGACRWSLVDLPSKVLRTKAALKATCGTNNRVTWNEKAKEALIVLAQTEFWSVDLASAATTHLPRPPDGEVVRFKIDDSGRAWVLTVDGKLHPDKKGRVKYGGQAFVVSTERDTGESFGLVHIFSYDSDGQWHERETTLLEVSIPEAPSYDDIKSAAMFETGATFEEPQPRGQEVVSRDLLGKIKAAGNGWGVEEGTVGEGYWMALGVTPTAYYRAESMEGEYQTQDLVFTIHGQFVPASGPEGGNFDYDARGSYVLRASSTLGEPTVFDARTGQTVFTSPTASGASFGDVGLRESKMP